MGKSSMPAAPWKQFEALIERLKETNRYHNILWTTTIITTKITTTLMTWQIKSSPCTFSPTCGARSWERPSQRPSCWKTSFIHIWPCCIFFGLIISIAKTKKIWWSPWCQRLLPGPVLKSLSVSLGIRLKDLLLNQYFLKNSNIWDDGMEHCPWSSNWQRCWPAQEGTRRRLCCCRTRPGTAGRPAPSRQPWWRVLLW